MHKPCMHDLYKAFKKIIKERLTNLTALSRSQSAKTTNGDFPPSSRETFFRLLFAQLSNNTVALFS